MSGRVPIVKVLWRLVRNDRARYAFSSLIWTLIWTSPVVVGLVAAAFFDSLTDQAGWDIPTLIAALWGYLLGRIALVFLGMRTHSAILFRAGAGMQRAMLRWIYALPGAQPVAETSGEVVSRFRDDIEHTTEAFDFTVDLIGSTVSSVVAVIVLVSIDPLITAIVFTPIIVVVAVTSRVGSRIRRYRREARDSTEGITGFLGEMLGAVQSVKVADAEQPMLAHFESLNDYRRKMMVRDRTFTAAIEAVFYNTVSIGTGLILILAAGALSADGGLTVGDFTLFVFLLQLVTEAAWFVGIFLARVRQAEVSVERMVGLMRGADWRDLTRPQSLDRPIPVTEPPTVETRPGAPLLVADGLTFAYPTSNAGIDEVDLEVEEGSFVVVTGKIGSGKTTLLRSVLGLVPAEGEVRWRGVPVDPSVFMVPPRAAYTSQAPRLFSMSLRDNLLLGHGADEGGLARAVAVATMDLDVSRMADGYDTLVGPRGVRLSGGQAQRSAAARMLVREPELMVFDDLSSALDVETEAELWDGLLGKDRSGTVLAVSHRRPALARADEILVMDGGRVVARGTAEELLERSELFRELWGRSRAT